MTKINFKSDFKLIAPLPKTLNFIFHYTTDESICYDVSVLNGRAIVQDENLIIVFEDHKLPEGQLKVRKEYFIDDEDAKDDILDVVTGEYLDIFLLDCKTDQFKGIVVEEELTIYRGYSAYLIAVKNGFVGTESEWLESLKEPAKQAAIEAENKVNALVNEGYADLSAIKSDYSTFIGNTRVEIDGLIENADEAVTKANDAVITATDAATRAQDAVTRANTAISDANTATAKANTAATAATSAANSATTAANNANNATAQFNTKLSEINTAITNATNATTNANSATVSATNAASAANSAAEYANTEGSKVAPLIVDVREFMEDNQATIDDMVDKVETFDKRVDDLQLFKTPNLTLFGAPTINEGQISNFTATDYAAFPFLVDFKSRPFEINMCLTTATNLSGQHNIFDSDFGLALAIRERKIVLAASTNGISWDLGEHVGTSTLPTNTTVYLKLVYDGTTYTMYYSLDKTTYNTEFTFTGGALYPKQIIIGKSINNANYFNGSINLNNCYLLIDGLQIWQGMDDAGLATRLATDLSNIDAAGESKLQGLVNNKANIDGYYAMFGAGTADNLAARGDSYEVEFGGTRKTGGDLDVEEGSATIKSIKGRTLVFNQLSSFMHSVYNNTQVAGGSTAYSSPLTVMNDEMKKGHYYFVKLYGDDCNFDSFRIRYPRATKAVSLGYGVIIDAKEEDTYTKIAIQAVVNNLPTDISSYTYTSSDLTALIFDLTQMFGAGNEPATAEEFANRIGYNSVEEIPYFEYNEGELINNDVKAIKSTGLNLWDEQWEVGNINYLTGELTATPNMIRSKNFIPIIPLLHYYIDITKVSYNIIYYDKNKNYIGYNDVSFGFTPPSNCSYIKFKSVSNYGNTYKHDICININDELYNGTYEPHEVFTRPLPTNKYFPDGLKSAGSVYDEMTSTKAIKRIGVVDLGSLNWLLNTRKYFTANLPTMKLDADNSVRNVICSSYLSETFYRLYYNEQFNYGITNGISGNYVTKQLTLVDTSVNSALELKEKLNGVYAYYILEEPEETEYDELNLMYNVHPLGTETVEFNTDGVHTYRGEHIYGIDCYNSIKSLRERVRALEAKVN